MPSSRTTAAAPVTFLPSTSQTVSSIATGSSDFVVLHVIDFTVHVVAFLAFFDLTFASLSARISGRALSDVIFVGAATGAGLRAYATEPRQMRSARALSIAEI